LFVSLATFASYDGMAGFHIMSDCAAIPSGSLKSDFFGHERGALSGTVSQKIGRLEQADQGLLFLDEIGDIPFRAATQAGSCVTRTGS